MADNTERLKFLPYDMKWLIEQLRSGTKFSVAGFSDAEWYSMAGIRIGGRTGLGQVLDTTTGSMLLDVLKRRHDEPGWWCAMPGVLPRLPGLNDGELDRFLAKHHIDQLLVLERDCMTDDLAEAGGLYPFIQQLREMDTVMIGPQPLQFFAKREIGTKQFYQISTPNLHMEPGGLEEIVRRVMIMNVEHAVYLVSAGVSAALIIDRLHDFMEGCCFIDCGSIWDGFVRLGGQRAWRDELYHDDAKWHAWKRACLEGTPYDRYA